MEFRMDSFNKFSKGHKYCDNIWQFLRHFLAKQKPYFSPKDDRIISFENHYAWKAWERRHEQKRIVRSIRCIGETINTKQSDWLRHVGWFDLGWFPEPKPGVPARLRAF